MKTEMTTFEQEPTSLIAYDDSSPLLQDGMFEKMIKLADLMAKSQTLPEHFHNRPGDCLRVIELAHRMRQSPFALADWCYMTGGKLSMEGKGIAALVNSSPRIVGSLDYKYSGNKNNPAEYACTVIGLRRGEEEPREVKVTLKQGIDDSTKKQKDGSMKCNPRWHKDPDQMLAYYGSRVWARRWAPEVIGGLYTPDELNAVQRDESGRAVVIQRAYKKPIKDIPIVIAPPITEPGVPAGLMKSAFQEMDQAAVNDDDKGLKKAFAFYWGEVKTHDATLLPELKQKYEGCKAFMQAKKPTEEEPVVKQDEWTEAYDNAEVA
jgi:hypothetical protein